MQELNLIPTLTVAESIFIDRLPNRLGWVDRKQLHRDARAVLARVGLGELDPATLIGSLGIGQQQLVEIAAGLATTCRVLILDEPTAALTNKETELLFAQIEKLRSAGAGVIYISHRMEEILRIADRVTVLRDGRVVGARSNLQRGKQQDATLLQEIIHLMVGRDLGAAQFRPKVARAEMALRVSGLRAGSAVKDVSFDLRRGEILGFAGLMGSGRTETMRAIFGADRRDAGTMYVGASATPAEIASPQDAVRAGIALLTEDRKGEGLLLPWAVRSNVTLPTMRSVRSPLGWIDRVRESATASRLVSQLRVRCSSVEQPVRELSGGNQQKVVIAKWLERDCDVLIFDEPTRGIDVGAKFEIYELLRDLAGRGKAIIVVSSELPELFAICNRIAVLSAGSLVRIFGEQEFDQNEIMRAALTNY